MLCAPIRHAKRGVGHIEQLFGAGDADVEEPTFFFERQRIRELCFNRATDGQEILFDASDEHDREFQTLGE